MDPPPEAASPNREIPRENQGVPKLQDKTGDSFAANIHLAAKAIAAQCLSTCPGQFVFVYLAIRIGAASVANTNSPVRSLRSDGFIPTASATATT